MPFDDRHTDPTLPARSLSEQLRDLQARLGQANEIGLPPEGRITKLPTCLGRPIGLMQPEGFPRLPPPGTEQDDAIEAAPVSRGAALRRGATVVGAGLLLLATTAILPPLLLRHAVSEATQPTVSEPFATPERTEKFAESARELLRAATSPAVPEVAPTAYFEPAAAVGEASDIEAILLAPPKGLAAVRRTAPEGPSGLGVAPATDQPPPWAPFGTRSAP